MLGMLSARCLVPGAGRGHLLVISSALRTVSALWWLHLGCGVLGTSLSPVWGMWPLEVSRTILTHPLILGAMLRGAGDGVGGGWPDGLGSSLQRWARGRGEGRQEEVGWLRVKGAWAKRGTSSVPPPIQESG